MSLMEAIEVAPAADNPDAFVTRTLRVRLIGRVARPRQSEETGIHCPLGCEDPEDMACDANLRRSPQGLFCAACGNGFTEERAT